MSSQLNEIRFNKQTGRKVLHRIQLQKSVRQDLVFFEKHACLYLASSQKRIYSRSLLDSVWRTMTKHSLASREKRRCTVPVISDTG